MDINEFFTQHSNKEHYANIKPRPNQFEGWESDWEKRNNYARWIESESDIPSLVLDLPKLDVDAVAKEAESILDEFVKHRGDAHPGWTSVTLHGYDKSTTDDWNSPAYADRGWTEMPPYDWTEIAPKCPTIVDWLKNVWQFKTFHRVRFMKLAPGGYIKPHKDFDTRKLAAYNVAITNPPGHEFCMEDAGLIPWQAGEVRAIDIGRHHSVRNVGTEPRIHMIIHGQAKPSHWAVLCRSYDKLLQDRGML